MTKSPLVSTIIPAYNAEPWLAAAIDSALLQNVDQEILVINDGSNDRTAEIAASYGLPVRLLNKTNGGVSSARNLGLAEARGEFVAFLDADDVWLPGKLGKQLDAFRDFPTAGTVICDEMHVNDDGQVIKSSFFATKSYFEELPKTTSLAQKPMTWLVKESLVPTSGVVTKRLTAQLAGQFDETLSIVEDRDYWIRLALAAPIVIVPEVLLRYRIGNPAGLSQASREKWAKNLSTVLLRHIEQLKVCLTLEKTNVDEVLGESFNKIAETLWQLGDYSSAATNFKISKIHKKGNIIKQLLAEYGLAPSAILVKNIFSKND